MPSRNPLISKFLFRDTGDQALIWPFMLWAFKQYGHSRNGHSCNMGIHVMDNHVKDIHDIRSNRWSRVIVVCWGFAFLPAIPLMFNSTIEVSWENQTNCKCFYPLDDVSISFISFQTNKTMVYLRNRHQQESRISRNLEKY